MQKTNTGLVAYAKAQLGQPYWWGTFGQIATAALYKSKKAQYPDQYRAKDFSIQYGKRVHDCIGLIKGYLWSDTPTDTPCYDASQDKSAPGMYAVAVQKGPIATFDKVVGRLVFRGKTPSSITHVGVYGGDGYVYEAKGHAYGVVKTRYRATDWQYWAQCPYILDNTKNKEVDDMPKVEKIPVMINGKKVQVDGILHNGTNYLSIRQVATLLDCNVTSSGSMPIVTKK